LPCYRPLLAFQHKSEKTPLKFVWREASRDEEGFNPYETKEYKELTDKESWMPLAIPCNKCVWCRLQNAREKAIRVINEARQYEDNCFLTLTYNDDHLPRLENGKPIYQLRDIQLFAKRIRKALGDHKIKTFGCAEYGEQLDRPHFHLIILNFDFKDKYFWRYSENDWSNEKWPTYRSPKLEELWPHGYSEIGTVTEESAGYVARYVTKKITGEGAYEHYEGRPPERLVCNSKGIGLAHLEQYADTILNNQSVIWKDQEVTIPRYYKKKLEELYPSRYAEMRERLKSKIKEIDLDSTRERLQVRERVHNLKAERLKGKL